MNSFIPLMTSDDRPSDWVKLSDYRQIGYFNTFLSTAVILQNYLVISGYYPQRKKLIPLLFLLIASADMLIAVGELLRVVLVFSCPHRQDIQDSMAAYPALVSLVPSISILGWTCSTYYNVVLTVYRTVTIADPFSASGWRKTVLVAIVIGTALWFSVQVIAILSFLSKYSMIAYQNHYKTICSLLRMHLSLPDIIEYLLVGLILFSYHTIDHFVVYVGAPVQVAIQGLPSLVTLICIPIQIYFLRKSLRVSEVAANLFKESNKMTVTIILINILDVVSDMFCVINYVIHASGGESKHSYRILVILAVSTFPLLNAFGFQLIMILRNKSMKAKYVTVISFPFICVSRSVNWVRKLVRVKIQFKHTTI